MLWHSKVECLCMLLMLMLMSMLMFNVSLLYLYLVVYMQFHRLLGASTYFHFTCIPFTIHHSLSPTVILTFAHARTQTSERVNVCNNDGCTVWIQLFSWYYCWMRTNWLCKCARLFDLPTHSFTENVSISAFVPRLLDCLLFYCIYACICDICICMFAMQTALMDDLIVATTNIVGVLGLLVVIP